MPQSAGIGSHRGDLPTTANSRSLRILAVGNMYPPHHAGGYELMWQHAMRHARTEGHRVRVLTSDYRDNTGLAEQDPDVHRTLRWYWDLSRYEFPRLSLVDCIRLERHNAAQLRRHIAEFAPDVVTWWSMGCMSLSLIEQARRIGVPGVFVVHDDWLAYGWLHDRWIRTWRGPRRGRLAPIAEWFVGVPGRVEFNAAGSFIFNSRYTLERAQATCLHGPPATVIYPGIDDRFVHPLPPQPWRWQLTCIGRIDRMKGIDTAVRALAHLPAQARLTVWGSGDRRYIGEMLTLAERLGVASQVTFRGFASAEAVGSAYGAADAVLFPVRWNEPFGLVPLEAMAVGRPVVATARGGTAEFLRDGENALVVSADDAPGLAEGVKRLAQDARLRARLREGGFGTAAGYTVSQFAQRTVREIARAASTPRQSSFGQSPTPPRRR